MTPTLLSKIEAALLRYRERLNVAGEFLVGHIGNEAGRSAYAAVLYVQSSLKLDAESLRAGKDAEPPFDLVSHLRHQREWSTKTFGPGPRTKGVCDHIRKELNEIEADPLDLKEWIDVILLAFDGAWRAGWEPEKIIAGIVAKQSKNESRDWPDWRTSDPNKAIEHIREENAEPSEAEFNAANEAYCKAAQELADQDDCLIAALIAARNARES